MTNNSSRMTVPFSLTFFFAFPSKPIPNVCMVTHIWNVSIFLLEALNTGLKELDFQTTKLESVPASEDFNVTAMLDFLKTSPRNNLVVA